MGIVEVWETRCNFNRNWEIFCKITEIRRRKTIIKKRKPDFQTDIFEKSILSNTRNQFTLYPPSPYILDSFELWKRHLLIKCSVWMILNDHPYTNQSYWSPIPIQQPIIFLRIPIKNDVIYSMPNKINGRIWWSTEMIFS